MKIYHDAYLDFRVNPSLLRVYSINPCVRASNYLSVDLHYEGVTKPTRLKLKGDSLQGLCPSFLSSAKYCLYNPYAFIGELEVHGGLEKVACVVVKFQFDVLHFQEERETLESCCGFKNPFCEPDYKKMEKRREKGLTVCVQPVYYYTQWQNIILYIESWIAQGASRFIVFYHSGTRETRKVLEHCQNLGIIELRSWPFFGNVPSGLTHKYPNFEKTSIGTIADFDEVMVAREGRVVDYALREMTGTIVGALQFETRYVTMSPSIYTSNFSGVDSPVFIERWQYPKYMFNVSTLEVAKVHYIRSFFGPKVTKIADGGVLYFRYGIDQHNYTTVNKPLRFFPNEEKAKFHTQRMEDTKAKELVSEQKWMQKRNGRALQLGLR